MVESTALEMRHTRKGIEGSNPSLSATPNENISDLALKRLWPRIQPHFHPQAMGLAYQGWLIDSRHTR